MQNHPINRSLSVTLDGELLSFSGRMRLRGKDELSLFPALFTLDLWNLPEEMVLRLSRCRNIAVSHMDACLVSGRVWDVFRHTDQDGVLTTVAISLGLELWESVVSLIVPVGTTLSETVRQILAASGTGICLLADPDDNPVSARPQSFFGRASECIATVLSAISAREMLTPSGLMIVLPDGLTEAVYISEADLTDVAAFTGGSQHGSPKLMILQAAVSGWRPGQTVEVEYKEIRARGIVTERSVDADTGYGAWKCELLVEVIT